MVFYLIFRGFDQYSLVKTPLTKPYITLNILRTCINWLNQTSSDNLHQEVFRTEFPAIFETLWAMNGPPKPGQTLAINHKYRYKFSIFSLTRASKGFRQSSVNQYQQILQQYTPYAMLMRAFGIILQIITSKFVNIPEIY